MTTQELKTKAQELGNYENTTIEGLTREICQNELKEVDRITDFEIIENYEYDDAENVGIIYELEDGYIATIENSEMDYVKYGGNTAELQKWLTDEIYNLNQ